MAAAPLADNGKDLSALVTLARLKKAKRLDWLAEAEKKALLSGMQPLSRRVAEVFLGVRSPHSGEEKETVSMVERLAGV